MHNYALIVCVHQSFKQDKYSSKVIKLVNNPGVVYVTFIWLNVVNALTKISNINEELKFSYKHAYAS